MKIATIVGARPQLIKASPVSHAFKSHGSRIQEILIHTGQHFDANMSDVFFKELGMAAPAYNLGIHGGSHGEMTGRMLIEIERVLLAEKPDAVLVYGDTNSTIAGALAASKLHIPVAHVEAGLRSFNLAMPEEINRILTDRISRWLFTPSAAAREHLLREGTQPSAIIPVGDVMYDAALFHGSRIDATSRSLGLLNFSPGKYILATIHRAENTDSEHRLKAIIDGLSEVAESIPIVWPLHPRTRAVLQKMGQLDRLPPGMKLIDPVGYLDMVQLEKYAALVATDSGGVQKEAFFWRVPCVTLRDETEWVELIDAGWNRLAPPETAQAITQAILGALGTKGVEVQPFGDGTAANAIAAHLLTSLTVKPVAG